MIDVDVRMPRLFAEGAGELQLTITLIPGSLTAIVGPSGAGKTTLLRLLAGLETPPRGRIAVGQTLWLDTGAGINLPSQQRSIGYVFQDTALFPNMTVRENIRFAAPPHQQKTVDDLIDATGLTSLAGQKPTALSGGQRQRVALARALVRRPTLLLLDEPFAALDTAASQTLRQLVGQLHRDWGTTTLLVSHYDADVQALADRVIRLEQGAVATDQRISQRPVSPVSEPIERLYYDETTRQWVLETATMQLRSTNPAWAKLRAGDVLRVSC